MMNINAFSAVIAHIICAMNFGATWMSSNTVGVSVPMTAFCQSIPSSICAKPYILPEDHLMVYLNVPAAEVYIPRPNTVFTPSPTVTSESNDARIPKSTGLGTGRLASSVPDWRMILSRVSEIVNEVSTGSATQLRQAYSDVDEFARNQQSLVDQAISASGRTLAQGWSHRQAFAITAAIISLLWVAFRSALARECLHFVATNLGEIMEPGLTRISKAVSDATDAFLWIAAAILHILFGCTMELLFRTWRFLATCYRETRIFLQGHSAQDHYDFGRAIARAMIWGSRKSLWALVEAARRYYVIQYQIAESVAWYMKHGILWVVAQCCRVDYSMVLIVRQKDKLQALQAENAFLNRRDALPFAMLQSEINSLKEQNANLDHQLLEQKAKNVDQFRQQDETLCKLEEARHALEERSVPTPRPVGTSTHHVRNIVLDNRSRTLAKQVTTETDDGQAAGAEFLSDLLVHVHRYDSQLYRDVMSRIASRITPPPTEVIAQESSTKHASPLGSMPKDDKLPKAKLSDPAGQMPESGKASSQIGHIPQIPASISPIAQDDSIAKSPSKSDRLTKVKPSEPPAVAVMPGPATSHAKHRPTAALPMVTKPVTLPEEPSKVEKPWKSELPEPNVMTVGNKMVEPVIEMHPIAVPSVPLSARPGSPLKSSLKTKSIPHVKLQDQNNDPAAPTKSVSFQPTLAPAPRADIFGGLDVPQSKPKRLFPKSSKKTQKQISNSAIEAGGASQPASTISADTIVSASNVPNAISEAMANEPDKMDVDLLTGPFGIASGPSSSESRGPTRFGANEPEDSHTRDLAQVLDNLSALKIVASPSQNDDEMTWPTEMDTSGAAPTAAPAIAPSQPFSTQFQSTHSSATAQFIVPVQPSAQKFSFTQAAAPASTQNVPSQRFDSQFAPTYAASAAPQPAQTQLPATQASTSAPFIGPIQPSASQFSLAPAAATAASQTGPLQPLLPRATPAQQFAAQDFDMEDAQVPITAGPSSVLSAPVLPAPSMTGTVALPSAFGPPIPPSASDSSVLASSSGHSGLPAAPRTFSIPVGLYPSRIKRVGMPTRAQSAQSAQQGGQKYLKTLQGLPSDTTLEIAGSSVSGANPSVPSGREQPVQAEISDGSAAVGQPDQSQSLPYNLGAILEYNQSHGDSQAVLPIADTSTPSADMSAASSSTSKLPGLPSTVSDDLIDPALLAPSTASPHIATPPTSIVETLKRRADAWAVSSEWDLVEAVCAETEGDEMYRTFVRRAIDPHNQHFEMRDNLRAYEMAHKDLRPVLCNLMKFKCGQWMLRTHPDEKRQLGQENFSWFDHVGGNLGYRINWHRVSGLADHRFVCECVKHQWEISEANLKEAQKAGKEPSRNPTSSPENSDEELYDRDSDEELYDEGSEDRIDPDHLDKIHELTNELDNEELEKYTAVFRDPSSNVTMDARGAFNFTKCTKVEGLRCLKQLFKIVTRDVKWKELNELQQREIFQGNVVEWVRDGVMEDDEYSRSPPWEALSLHQLELLVDQINEKRSGDVHAMLHGNKASSSAGKRKASPTGDMSGVERGTAHGNTGERLMTNPITQKIMVDDTREEGAERWVSGHEREPRTIIPGLSIYGSASSPAYGSGAPQSGTGSSAYTFDRTANQDHARLPTQFTQPPQVMPPRGGQRFNFGASNAGTSSAGPQTATPFNAFPFHGRQSAGPSSFGPRGATQADHQAGENQADMEVDEEKGPQAEMEVDEEKGHQAEMEVDKEEGHRAEMEVDEDGLPSTPIHERRIAPLRRARRRPKF